LGKLSTLRHNNPAIPYGTIARAGSTTMSTSTNENSLAAWHWSHQQERFDVGEHLRFEYSIARPERIRII